MNFWTSNQFKIPSKPFDRGKVLDKAGLEKAGKFERYRDVDGDGIPYRTLPGTNHPLASYFLRGSGHNEGAKYTEKAEDYVNLMDRLKKKFETAKKYVPRPVIEKEGSKVGIVAYGTTDLPMKETRDLLKAEGIKTDYLRLRALPFTEEVAQFYKDHDRVYVVEQNRDGQVDQLLRLELGEQGLKNRSVKHYDGLPIDARSVFEGIMKFERNKS